MYRGRISRRTGKTFYYKKEKILLYKDIIEVQKIMKITRYTTNVNNLT